MGEAEHKIAIRRGRRPDKTWGALAKCWTAASRSGKPARHAMLVTINVARQHGEGKAMPDVCGELAGLLSTVQRPGDFYATGRVELLAPRLAVDGIGPIAFPLLSVQAEQLIAIAERAPYGRGAATILDTNVRRTWQITPDRVRLGGKHWQETLERIVARAAEGLGVDDPVSADLYKLL